MTHGDSLRTRAFVVLATLALVASVGGTVLHQRASQSAAPLPPNPVTPGDMVGKGFDQCEAPSQAAMDAWMQHSPYLAVGIYISGASRGCRAQTNLTPTWVRTQLANGWKLLPITLGPQASCSTRFPRYGKNIDPTIDPRAGENRNYPYARAQGLAEGADAVEVASSLGIVEGSVLFYDLEGFNSANNACRESALRFLSAWTTAVNSEGYLSGVYSSASSGMKALDQARITRPTTFNLPDYLWIADWNNKADTRSSYISDEGWQPHLRVHQYRGGHKETWGGVTINIDNNWLDVGRGAYAQPVAHCDPAVRIGAKAYPTITPATASKRRPAVRALQCLLQEQGFYSGRLHGRFGPATRVAVRDYQTAHGIPAADLVDASLWVRLLSAGAPQLVKLGSAGEHVRRLQRALNATGAAVLIDAEPLAITGIMDDLTIAILKAWQKAVGVKPAPIAKQATWDALQSGAIPR